MRLLEVVIPNITFKYGANNLNFIRVRLGYVMLILMLFAPQMNIIFAISTSNNTIINKIMHEKGGVPQLDIYLAPNLGAGTWGSPIPALNGIIVAGVVHYCPEILYLKT